MIIILTCLYYIMDFLINYFFMINSNTLLSSYLVFSLLIFVYPFFENKNRYLVYSALIGILFSYNISSILINVVCLFLIGLFIKYYFKFKSFNLSNIIILSVTTFIVYLTMLGVIMFLNYYESFNIFYHIKPLYNSLIINTIIIILTYILIHKKVNKINS